MHQTTTKKQQRQRNFFKELTTVLKEETLDAEGNIIVGGDCSIHAIDLFSLGGLFSHFKSCDILLSIIVLSI